MRVMYFCYEHSHVDGQWQPAVFYDEDPSLLKSSNGKESNRVLSKTWLVPEDCCDYVLVNLPGSKKATRQLEPNFGRLQTRFPKP